MSKNRKSVQTKPSQKSPNSSPYAPQSFRLISKDDLKIYKPNIISVKKRIISA